MADSADRLYNFLEGENRLDPPNHCPRSIYNLMLRCWNLEPKERPLFDSIAAELYALVNPQYHQTYDDRVRRLGEQHVTIQNKLYQLMTSENHIFPGNIISTSPLVTNPTCFGFSNGSIDLNATGDAPIFSFLRDTLTSIPVSNYTLENQLEI